MLTYVARRTHDLPLRSGRRPRLEGWGPAPFCSSSFETLASLAPQRLCHGSSGLPWRFVPEDGVEDEEKFVSDGDGSDHLGFAGSEMAFVESLKNRIVALGDLSAKEEGGSYGRPSATDMCLTFPLAGLADVGNEACQSADLLAAQRAKLRQVGHHGAGNDAADPRHRGQKILLL